MLSFRGTWLPEGSGYFVYPNRDHGLHEGNGTEVHVRMLIIRYLLEHLPPGPR
jgi:dipeptidyl-peptidase-4